MKLKENEKLYLARRRAKLTQEGLAEALGISQGMISHMETGFWSEVSSEALAWIKETTGDVQATLERYEEAAIKRRRLGLDLKQVALEVGIPSWVLGKFEEGEELPSRVAELRAYCAWLRKQPLPSV